MEGKREFGVNAVVSYLAACQKSSREYVRDIYCLGRLSALSTDSFFVVQSLITSIVRSPVKRFALKRPLQRCRGGCSSRTRDCTCCFGSLCKNVPTPTLAAFSSMLLSCAPKLRLAA